MNNAEKIRRASLPRHPARARSALASVFLILSALLLGACATTGGGTSKSAGESRALRLADDGQYAAAADIYAGLAAIAISPERERLTMHAVEHWLNAGDTTRARDALQGMPEPAPGDTWYRWRANHAALALFDGDPEMALNVLEPLSREPLPAGQRIRVEALRADAWFQKGDPMRATELMLAREKLLGSRAEREQNLQRLWTGLTLSRPRELLAAAELALDEEVRGWLSLGALAASTGQQGIGWSNGVVRWREQHAGHPAMRIVDDLNLSVEDLTEYPRQIALLLPLSGRNASAGLAVQNGFLGAYFLTAGGLDDRQTLRVYDINAEGGAAAAYQNAVADGAEFVVGPLLRSSVSELANDILVPVPLLTLNYLPDNTLAPPGLYQFALAPEDEAIAAAERAMADGHQRAVALVPNNSWGRRMFASFATAFESMGGTLLDSRTYTTGNQDFSNTIEDLMALSGSARRYQRLRANIGGPLQFDPRRRQDSEFIFLAADASAARLLKSQLKFHYSGDIPVYSTSRIYAMDGRSDSDLNGVMFADTPWIIDPQPWIKPLPPMFAEYWPEQKRLGRLHAMGYDAYHLVASLFAARGGDMEEVDGASGRLYLDEDGRVHRRMAWAQFQGGQPVGLAEPDPIGGPIRDESEDGTMQDPEATDADSWYETIEEM